MGGDESVSHGSCVEFERPQVLRAIGSLPYRRRRAAFRARAWERCAVSKGRVLSGSIQIRGPYRVPQVMKRVSEGLGRRNAAVSTVRKLRTRYPPQQIALGGAEPD